MNHLLHPPSKMNKILFRPEFFNHKTEWYYTHQIPVSLIWCDFDRASTLICGNKMSTRCNTLFLLQILLFARHVSGTTVPIIRSSRVLYRWLLPVVFGALVFKLSVWCGVEGYVSCLRAAEQPANHLYNTLELLMMGIVVPETCSTSNKICNKNHVLHLVGIWFPNINNTSCFTEQLFTFKIWCHTQVASCVTFRICT
jgi:hypothetical protein